MCSLGDILLLLLLLIPDCLEQFLGFVLHSDIFSHGICLFGFACCVYVCVCVYIYAAKSLQYIYNLLGI